MLPELQEHPVYPRRGSARFVIVGTLLAYAAAMVLGYYGPTPLLLIYTAQATHSYWYQETRAPSDLNRGTAAAAIATFGTILGVSVAVLILGWRPSAFGLTLGFQAFLFAWIAGTITYHLLLPRIRRAA